MFVCSYNHNLDSGSNPAQLCALNLYNSAQESAIGGIVDIPLPNTTSFQALQINAGWLNDIKDAYILREKLGVSAAHLSGIKRVLCTPFADTDWDLTPAQMKTVIDLAAVLGANAFSPRPFFYTVIESGKSTPLPSQSYQSTFWAHYKQFADYTARLSFALSQGSHKAQVALLNPINTLEYEFTQDPMGIPNRLTLDYFKFYCENLLKEHIDYDIVSEESISRALAVDQHLIIQDEEYEMLIIPPSTSITHAAAVKIAEYAEDGGAILATTLLPFRDADGAKHEEVRRIFMDIFDMDPEALRANAVIGTLTRRPALGHNSSNLLFYECADSSELTHGLRGMVSMGIKPEVSIRRSGSECRDIIYHHRIIDDNDIFFFVNTSRITREVKLSIRCNKLPYKLDPETGQISALANCTQKGDRTLFLYKFEPTESLLIYFTNELILPAVQHKCENRNKLVLVDIWNFSIHGHNCITLPDWNLDTPIQHPTPAPQFKTHFSVEAALHELLLVIERPSSKENAYSVLINGAQTHTASDWVTDINFAATNITELIKPGTNEIIFVWKNKSANCNPPKARLMGSFSLDKSCSALMGPRDSMRSGSWTDHGYPFYSGSASYTQEIEIPQLIENQRVFLRANSPAHIVEFVVNGEKAGTRLWPSFEIDITAFTKPGLNTIEIKVTNSPASMMLQEPRLSGLINGAQMIICS
ncbi:MAG: glycosyl hydrolase [Armatimonadetes bacterium]|nr:glycosyl hydrolase [Armatimonadota bacterium]